MSTPSDQKDEIHVALIGDPNYQSNRFQGGKIQIQATFDISKIRNKFKEQKMADPEISHDTQNLFIRATSDNIEALKALSSSLGDEKLYNSEALQKQAKNLQLMFVEDLQKINDKLNKIKEAKEPAAHDPNNSDDPSREQFSSFGPGR